MNEMDPASKSRLTLWLRGERAFGLTAVRAVDLDNVVSKNVPQAPVVQREAVKIAPPVVQVSQIPKPRQETSVPKRVSKPATAQLALITPPDAPGFAAPLLARDQKIVRLQMMDEKEVSVCTRCRLHETRTRTVFGEGDPDAKIFFCG